MNQDHDPIRGTSCRIISPVIPYLFISKRDIKYIHTSVWFLTTHVKNPKEENFSTLNFILKYMKVMVHMKLNMVIWLDDLSYNIQKILQR